MLSENKIAIVTGASTGLGQSISIKLAQKGYEIVLASRNKQKLNHLKNLISENGGVAKVIIADVSKEDDVKNLYSKINFQYIKSQSHQNLHRNLHRSHRHLLLSFPS